MIVINNDTFYLKIAEIDFKCHQKNYKDVRQGMGYLNVITLHNIHVPKYCTVQHKYIQSIIFQLRNKHIH